MPQKVSLTLTYTRPTHSLSCYSHNTTLARAHLWPDPSSYAIHTCPYGGFYPQIRYQIGETYGKTTSRLLTDPNVHKSPCSVLAPLGKPRFIEDFSGTKHPSKQMLDQNYSYFPGYTAPTLVPANGRQSSVDTETGESTQLREQRISIPAHPGIRLACGHGWRSSSCPAGTPQTSEQEERKAPSYPTETVDVSRYSQLPKLDVPNLIQRKAISGYTGFIPCFTWVMGVNYLTGVKDAMNEFDRNQFMVRNPVWNFGKRLPQTYWPNTKIYTSAGLIPFYTGFVPSKFIKRMDLRTETCGTAIEGWRGDEGLFPKKW
uniref:Ciliary microtubule inner protein 2A-C-like domain-containing protein n=1 Tax=Pelusios castaneus TaxID=367368 RepID=A0A8C8SYM2_9SAUR